MAKTIHLDGGSVHVAIYPGRRELTLDCGERKMHLDAAQACEVAQAICTALDRHRRVTSPVLVHSMPRNQGYATQTWATPEGVLVQTVGPFRGPSIAAPWADSVRLVRGLLYGVRLLSGWTALATERAA